jgi:hypothetical protein
MTDQTSILEKITLSFGTPEDPRATPVPRRDVRRWLKDAKDTEAQGALCSYLLDSHYASRVTPPLEFEDFHPFVSDYFLRCVREDPQGAWSDSRYIAGIALANWFKGLNNDRTVPRDALLDIKQSIQDAWDRADAATKDGILNGALEHIFEEADARRLFDDWQYDPRYADAYRAACESAG